MTGPAGGIELFLDETPGETRGVVRRDGRYTHLLIEGDDEIPQTRLGARAVGRAVEISPALRGAFVDLGAGAPAFLSTGRGDRLVQGERLEVVVTAEPRAGKGAAVRRLGPAEGSPRLIESAPTVAERLRLLAPDVEIVTGLAAIDAAVEAEEEALSDQFAFPAQGIDLAIERTRALVAVDIDHAPAPGRDPSRGRARANAEGLRQAARLIGLKHWGGLVVVDLVGDGREGEAALPAARSAFSDHPRAAFGPVSRFGLLQLSLPWTHSPVEEVLAPSARTRAQALARRLRREILADARSPRVTARCRAGEAAVLEPLARRLGPRAHVAVDPAAPPGGVIEGS